MPRDTRVILAEIQMATGVGLRCVGNKLFVVGCGSEVVFLNRPSALFAWLENTFQVYWKSFTGCVSRDVFFEYAQGNTPRYETIEAAPRFPPDADCFYSHPDLPPTDGSYLEKFLRFFNPASEADAALLKTLVAAPSWGGPRGVRPLILLSAADDDSKSKQKKRGVGKTTLIETIGELYGGTLQFALYDNKNQPIATNKSRNVCSRRRRSANGLRSSTTPKASGSKARDSKRS